MSVRNITLFLLLSSFSISVVAGNLINNAVIKSISSSNDGYSENFYMKFESGDGICASGGSFAVFPKKKPVLKQDYHDPEHSDLAFNRMFSIALTAFTTGKPVRVYSYGTDDCMQATMIEVQK